MHSWCNSGNHPFHLCKHKIGYIWKQLSSKTKPETKQYLKLDTNRKHIHLWCIFAMIPRIQFNIINTAKQEVPPGNKHHGIRHIETMVWSRESHIKFDHLPESEWKNQQLPVRYTDTFHWTWVITWPDNYKITCYRRICFTYRIILGRHGQAHI